MLGGPKDLRMPRVQAKPDVDSPWPGVEPGVLRASEPIRRLAGRNRTKADILVYRSGSVEIALKDYGRRPFLIRQLLGRYLIRRETAAYRAAAGLSGLPRFLGRVGPFALATEWVRARPLSSFVDERPDPACFDRARELLGELHRRGIALTDLHHRDLLVAEDGRVFFVDLAMAWVLGERPRSWRRRLFERLRRQDEISLARMRARFSGGDPDAAVAEIGGPAAAWHRRGRRIKSFLDRLRRRGRRQG